jgi:anti-sigma factor ChrR (cupin superfamily)
MSHTASEEAMKELAALYALGALDAGEAREFERHLAEGCGECAAELRDYEAVAAALALSAHAAAPPSRARAALLERVTSEVQTRGGGGDEASPSQFTGAADFVVVRGGEGEWVETADAGVFAKLLFVDKERDTVTTLVRLEPGARIAPHRHLGVEQCLVLEGTVRSGDIEMRGGDFICAMKGSVHREIYTDGGALLLIVSPEGYEATA